MLSQSEVARGHPPQELREAAHGGRLAYGYMENILRAVREAAHLDLRMRGFTASTELFQAGPA